MDLTTVDKLLTTTRSVRKRLDLTRPVEREVIERCIEIALQAPTGSNVQGWHFMVVTEAEKRAALADLYRKGIKAYADIQVNQPPQFGEEDLRTAQRPRVRGSSGHLGEHLHEVPVFVIPCIEVRMEEVPDLYGFSEHKAFYQATIFGSVLPAAWSLMLALRARGLGSAWTTLHLMYEKEAAVILGLPDHVMQAALLPVAYYRGADFKPAIRRPASELTHWNAWGRRQ